MALPQRETVLDIESGIAQINLSKGKGRKSLQYGKLHYYRHRYGGYDRACKEKAI
ncbi:hypothetical protein LEP3755_47750 [Leptolyngbya sp. NIES-3755]|nr:hypothetical protein LEP3755_47750 [Leptolyngbya sp. NIES-3755]